MRGEIQLFSTRIAGQSVTAVTGININMSNIMKNMSMVFLKRKT